jgi:hypothetical protein
MQLSLMMLAAASPSWFRGAVDVPLADPNEAVLIVTRLDGSPVQSPREAALAAQLAATAAAARGMPVPQLKSPDRLCFSVGVSAGFERLFGYSALEITSLHAAHGSKAAMLLLAREDFVAPAHLLGLQCALERITDLEFYAVLKTAATTHNTASSSPNAAAPQPSQSQQQYFVARIIQTQELDPVDHAPRRLITRFKPLVGAGATIMPPLGAHINILAPYSHAQQ